MSIQMNNNKYFSYAISSSGNQNAHEATNQITFIQNVIPPLQVGCYKLKATHSAGKKGETDNFTFTSTFIVQGERFAISSNEIDSVFPPNLSNGEFGGVLPHVVLTRSTLPWERKPGTSNKYPASPWLAVLVCDGADAMHPSSVKVQDLVSNKQNIIDINSYLLGQGTLESDAISYGYGASSFQLGYGETPDDPCMVVDMPVAIFNKIAPAAADLEYLAHVREVDTSDGCDSNLLTTKCAVVLANRIPPTNGEARAYLVSLEGMADYLPASDGTPSALIPVTVSKVRLIVYRTWSFTTNNMGEALKGLLTGLNTPAMGETHTTTLSLPIYGAAPAADQLEQAMQKQAEGKLSPDDATVLMKNALLMGYVPMNHHLRHGGNMVSFYRGPLSPLSVHSSGAAYYSGPDAANAYNPQTGLFDVSYGSAWQLGQLLALQSTGMANQLYGWKRSVTQHKAMVIEQGLLAERMQGQNHFESFFMCRKNLLSSPYPPLPPDVESWFSNLSALQGVPFNYLVPDERMLPPESIRFFYLDHNWIDALIDGAFSIGRRAVSEQSIEARHAPKLRQQARAGIGFDVLNRTRSMAASDRVSDTSPITGFLIRSKAIAGWPNLRVLGFSDDEATRSIAPLRIAMLSSDTMLCLFNGVLSSVLLREPPEYLHHGLEGFAGKYEILLRSLENGTQTLQKVSVSMRKDGQTVNINGTASTIMKQLNVTAKEFTAAEFALELTKGVIEVKYNVEDNK